MSMNADDDFDPLALIRELYQDDDVEPRETPREPGPPDVSNEREREQEREGPPDEGTFAPLDLFERGLVETALLNDPRIKDILSVFLRSNFKAPTAVVTRLLLQRQPDADPSKTAKSLMSRMRALELECRGIKRKLEVERKHAYERVAFLILCLGRRHKKVVETLNNTPGTLEMLLSKLTAQLDDVDSTSEAAGVTVDILTAMSNVKAVFAEIMATRTLECQLRKDTARELLFLLQRGYDDVPRANDGPDPRAIGKSPLPIYGGHKRPRTESPLPRPRPKPTNRPRPPPSAPPLRRAKNGPSSKTTGRKRSREKAKSLPPIA